MLNRLGDNNKNKEEDIDIEKDIENIIDNTSDNKIKNAENILEDFLQKIIGSDMEVKHKNKNKNKFNNYLENDINMLINDRNYLETTALMPNTSNFKNKEKQATTIQEAKIKHKLLTLTQRIEWFSNIARMNNLGYFMELCEAISSLELENLIELYIDKKR